MESLPQTYDNKIDLSSQNENYWQHDSYKQNRYFTNYKDEQSHSLFSYVPYLTAKIEIRFFQNSIHTKGLSFNNLNSDIPVREENDIQSFSVNSRRRLIKFISTIKYFSYSTILFTTLTYHQDFSCDPKNYKRDLFNYIKRIKRFYPATQYVWRLEEQGRGAPHYHILFFLPEHFSIKEKENFIQEIKTSWLEIKKCSCEYCNLYGVKTKVIDSTSKLLSYVSKYSAKVNEENPEHLIGRRWGYSENIQCGSIEVLHFSTEAYKYFFSILEEKIKSESRNTKYLDSLKDFDQDYFLFVSGAELLLLLNIHKDKFFISAKDGIVDIFLKQDGNFIT